MKKSILFLWVLFIPFVLFSQTVSNVQIGLKAGNIWYSPLASSVNVDPYQLPTTVSSITDFTYTFNYTAPASYGPNIDRLTFILSMRKTSSSNPNGQPEIVSQPYTASAASGTYTANFAGLNVSIENNETYTFTLQPCLDGPFGCVSYLAETPPYMFIRSNIPSKIYGNALCCGEDVSTYPYTPPLLDQRAGFILTSSDNSAMSFQWQINNNGEWNNIPFATSISYQPITITKNTQYRRMVTSALGTVNYSQPVTFSVPLCQSDKSLLDNQSNTICGRQSFYNLTDGQIVFPQDIIGSFVQPNITTREFGFAYEASEDGVNWTCVKDKEKIDLYSDSWMSQILLHNPLNFLTSNINHNGNSRNALLDYTPPPFTFQIQKGNTQYMYLRRKYYHKYDPWNCCADVIFDICGVPCGVKWVEWSTSNTVVLTFTTGVMKPVPAMIAPVLQASCNPTEVLTFSIPKINNNETFRWEIPSHYTSYSVMQGPNANSITVLTNAANKNYVEGGQVCVTLSQVGSDVRQCVNIKGTLPFTASLPVNQGGCEGKNVVLKPVVTENGSVLPDANPYTYTWKANQSPVLSCANPAGTTVAGCRELNIKVQFADQNPNQLVELSAKNIYGCEARASTVVTAVGGWQVGILNSLYDPQIVANGTIAIDVTPNHLYFTAIEGIHKAYFDNLAGMWKYTALKDKTTLIPIQGDGPLLFDKSMNYRLYYMVGSNLYYAESLDHGATWVNYKNSALLTNIDIRAHIYNGNLYYMNNTNRFIYYKPLNNLAAAPVLVGPVMLGGGESSFTVEEGVLAYADVSSKLLLFDALTGVPIAANIPSASKTIDYGSNISLYKGNVYYITNETIRILKKDITGVYSSFEDIPGNHHIYLAFVINKKTGTIYTTSSLANGPIQLYYLNGRWNSNVIRQYNNTPGYAAGVAGNQMVAANGHVYFGSYSGNLGNMFFIAPCAPSMQRAEMTNGDELNDPLPNSIPEIHLLNLVPNPASVQTRVSFFIQKAATASLQIVSVTGAAQIQQTTFVETGTHEWDLNLDSFAAGVYMVQLIVDGHVYGQAKLVKNQ